MDKHAKRQQREPRDVYARLGGLLELPVDKRPEAWNENVGAAFREYLGQEAEPHLVAALTERLPVDVAIAELSKVWESLAAPVRDKLVNGFKQKPVHVALAVGLADTLKANGQTAEAARFVNSALLALKKSSGGGIRPWVDAGGLAALLALLLDLRGRVADSGLGDLMAAAETALADGSKRTRVQVSGFLQSAKAALAAGALSGEAAVELSNRIVGLERIAAEDQPKARTKGASTGRGRGASVSGVAVSNDSSTEPAQVTPSGTDDPTKSPRRPVTNGVVPKNVVATPSSWSSPRAAIEAIGSLVSMLEELEHRREKQTMIDRIEEEKGALQVEAEALRGQLTTEQRLSAALKERVSDLEEALQSALAGRDALKQEYTGAQEQLKIASERISELHREHSRLYDQLPQQRLTEFRNNVRSRLKPILEEIAEFHNHPNLPHEAVALLDRCSALKEVLIEEQMHRG